MSPSTSGSGKAVKPQTIGRAPLVEEPGVKTDPLAVVALGASAGGLDAFRRLLDAISAGTGMAFILVQHLDPTHNSMLVELLTGHTPLTVMEAADGTRLEPEHIYVIPPGVYLTVEDGVLHLSRPRERHGARMPFDVLLSSLAEACGERAICVVLSGTGTDGTAGVKAIHAAGGWVIAQDPDEAGFDGMPRSAINTGVVNMVLPAGQIPDALLKGRSPTQTDDESHTISEGSNERLREIIELLRSRTAHDFRLYKSGTLRRRIERRMAMAPIAADRMDIYLKRLESDDDELQLLAKDLLINITSFFRDPEVFDLLARTTIRDLVANHPAGQPIRVWIAGCSTGEETYSLAILFRERIAEAKLDLKLQLFASDLGPDAVATAREGLYPETIEAQVSAARLKRFFVKDEHGYRVLPELRAAAVFTVQDVLADPPFSRLDMISCRNLLIYLGVEAQVQVFSLFHFALRPGGLLLLGSAETVGADSDRFEVAAKTERLYRRIGKSRAGDLGFASGAGENARPAVRPEARVAPSRQIALADLCRRLVTDAYAPAAVLINQKHACLFSLGPTDRYLRVAPGHSTQDLFAMARPGLRTKLRAAIHLAVQSGTLVTVPGGHISHDDDDGQFNISVRLVPVDGEDLLLVCFVDEQKQPRQPARPIDPADQTHASELEHELAATKIELQSAIHNLEISGEEQKAVNEEALSVNEEFQSTNEELLTSKEELQSLNEELTALNSQLQETLERQRRTSNDLQNVLYSTDVATLFLDPELNIRFFTPATKSLFSILRGDIGRPLADLHALAADSALVADAREILERSAPIEREVKTESGVWFTRRILPYRADNSAIEGVVVTFTDITERKRAARALEEAKKAADLANIAKSRFLAAASHDLRQPLQSLVFLQGLLAKAITGEREQELFRRQDQTLGAMAGMLNTLLDINQIEAGVVLPETITFPVNDLLDRLRDEFTYLAEAQGLALRVVGCGVSITSDPRLLDQMMRNLISNALKYTPKGRILVGCRRRKGLLSLEVWDTGIGIAEADQAAIFEEYHQIGNAARERSRGMGLGLSIVQRLGDLLDHRVRVLSHPGKGSVFSIEVATPIGRPKARLKIVEGAAGAGAEKAAQRKGNILVIEDDPEVRDILTLLLEDAGHRVAEASDGAGALDVIAHGGLRPDVVLADYSLPSGMTGLQAVLAIRERLHQPIPAIILTGDISTDTLRAVAAQNCTQLNKPVKAPHLALLIQQMLPAPRPTSRASVVGEQNAQPLQKPTIYVIDDNEQVRDGIRDVLEGDGLAVEAYDKSEAFLEAYDSTRPGCLLVDAHLPGMSGVDLLQRLHADGCQIPAIMITGRSDVSVAVQAMRAGAVDFIEKPVSADDLLASVDVALENSRDANKLSARRADAAHLVEGLTPRQHEIMDLVLAGHPSKNIAADLGISQRTVETHRASIMKKTGSRSLPALARIALAASANTAGEPTRAVAATAAA
jgi:two-component system CheB/CheR fusion protein